MRCASQRSILKKLRLVEPWGYGVAVTTEPQASRSRSHDEPRSSRSRVGHGAAVITEPQS